MMLNQMADLVVNKATIESVFLGQIDYTKANPYFLLCFRNNDGSTTAAYIEKQNKSELENIHALLCNFLTPSVWNKVGISFGKAILSSN